MPLVTLTFDVVHFAKVPVASVPLSKKAFDTIRKVPWGTVPSASVSEV